MPKFERKPNVVEAWRTKGNRNVQTADGPKQAQPGQWIVVVSNGIYELLDDAGFRARYVAKDKDAKKLLDAKLVTADEAAEQAKKDAAEEASVAVGNEATEEEMPKDEEGEEDKKDKSIAEKLKDKPKGKGDKKKDKK